MKHLKMPSKKHKGMFIYCSKCKKHFGSTKERNTESPPRCGSTGSLLSKCSWPDQQKFKVRIHIPGSMDRRVSRSFDTRDYKQAVSEAIVFQESLNDDFEPTTPKEREIDERNYLADIEVAYLKFLLGVDVPDHKYRERTDGYVKEIRRVFQLFNKSLQKNKLNAKMLRTEKISDTHVAYFHTYLLEDMDYANKTYNGKMSIMRSFFRWAIKSYNLHMNNPFEDVRTRSFKQNNKTISKGEFEALLEVISPENGIQKLGGKRKEKKNMYRDYLKVGFQLFLETGCRREEVVEIKWNMVNESDGVPVYIEIDNLKVLRIVGDGFNDSVRPKIIPITKSLRNLLFELGYENKKGSDEYIICPDRTGISSQTIMENISKGFKHYYMLLGTGRSLQLKCLRKTYLSYLKRALGEDTKFLSSHASDDILDRHYIDERILKKGIEDFNIFQ